MVKEANSSKWDAGRFVQTLAYFRVIPFLGSCSWLQKLFGGSSKQKQQSGPLVLVAGATGGVGKRVVSRLLKRGYQVRALVRSKTNAQKIIGDKVEIVEGDITIPETLTPTVTQNVTKIICCTGTKVQPVEGDTPKREKYYQGVKFYLPEVVDVPEMVEYKGIENLVVAVGEQVKQNPEQMLFDFSQPTEDLKEIWGVLDDVVMGGVSESSIRLADNTALFTGNVSTANSGGFASVRTRNFDPPKNLAGYNGIEMRVKGDGKRYKLILRCESKWDGVGYCYSFDTVYNIWITVRIPFEDLIPVFRAKTIKDGKPFDSTQLYSVQLMLSKFEYDRALNPKFSPGFFQLQVEYIKAYGADNLPKFVMVSSAGVTRPGRPGLNLDEEPPAVRLNDQLGGILTWKLKGEDAVRSSGIPYTIIRPCGMTEKAGGKGLIFDQGDNIKGLVSRDDIADLCVEVLERPQANKVTFEVKGAKDGDKPLDNKSLFAGLKPDV